MRVPSLTRRTLLIGASALGMGGLLDLDTRARAEPPRLARRILVVDWPWLPPSRRAAPERGPLGAPQGPQLAGLLADRKEEPQLHIPVLGLGTFGLQVLTTLASTRQTTALERLSATAGPWHAGVRHLVVVVADWGDEVQVRRAAQLACTCHAQGCLTMAIGPGPCGGPAHHGTAPGQAEFALVRSWADCLVTCPPVPSQQSGSCRPDWHTVRARAHLWAAQMIDGVADFLRLGMICTDLADLRVLFTRSGLAAGGLGRASGIDRASAALQHTLTGPWLDAATLARAACVLLQVTCSPDSTLYDLHEAASCVQAHLSPEACFIFGGRVEAQLPPETLQVMLVAGGLDVGATATGWG